MRAPIRSGETDGSMPDGVETVKGDLGDPDSRRSASEGADRIFLLGRDVTYVEAN